MTNDRLDSISICCKQDSNLQLQCLHHVNLYLISEFADELCVIVVSFDNFGLPASQVRCTLDKVWPERALSQEHILWLQIHLSDHLICNLKKTANQSLKLFCSKL